MYRLMQFNPGTDIGESEMGEHDTGDVPFNFIFNKMKMIRRLLFVKYVHAGVILIRIASSVT